MSTKPKRKPRPSPISDPDADRIRTATLLMASMLADRTPGTDLSFQRIQHASLAGALVLSGGALPDYSPVEALLSTHSPAYPGVFA
jgi:hypothetical protein